MRLRQSWKPRDWVRWLSAARRTVWLGGGTERFRPNTSFQPSAVLGASSVLTMVLSQSNNDRGKRPANAQSGDVTVDVVDSLRRRQHAAAMLNSDAATGHEGATGRTCFNLAISLNIDSGV